MTKHHKQGLAGRRGMD